ncbi:MAG: thiopeptide-type bacteriocin biosynthesis protein [Bacteroidota bacterium]
MTQLTKEHYWLSVYLYYNEPWEHFLTKAVEPYIRTTLDTGIADRFFFIRYWDRGPHIRLRIRGRADVIQPLVKPNLEEHFLSYFDSKPSKRTEPNYPAAFPAALKWLPNNTVQYIAYEPEVERYGGGTGIQLAESHFHLSSSCILELLRTNGGDWHYDDAMGAAIKLHLSFAAAVGWNAQEAFWFFRFYFYNWLPHSFRYFHKRLSQQEYLEQAGETLDAFRLAFEAQKELLLPYHASLWEALTDEEAEFEEALLNRWISGNRSIASQLEQAFQAGQISNRPFDYEFNPQLRQTLSEQDMTRWMLYADYLHMTNNRLGILNKDEGYLAYLIKECLKELFFQSEGRERLQDYVKSY